MKYKVTRLFLQAIETLNIDVECLCREGVCGTCETAILEGEAEHFDQYLSDAEKSFTKEHDDLCIKSKRQKIDIRSLIYFCGRSIA